MGFYGEKLLAGAKTRKTASPYRKLNVAEPKKARSEHLTDRREREHQTDRTAPLIVRHFASSESVTEPYLTLALVPLLPETQEFSDSRDGTASLR